MFLAPSAFGVVMSPCSQILIITVVSTTTFIITFTKEG